MTVRADVIVVGGGPAGASTAFRLAKRGVRVLVLDRAAFPRPKPCAECLSPQASRILHEMGALSELESCSAQMRGMIVHAPNGVSARGDYDAVTGFRGFRDRGLAIRRELLDAVLIRRARDVGADVMERTRVTDLLRHADGTVRGVRALDDAGQSIELEAQIVVGADGLRSIVAHRLGLNRAAQWPKRLSLVGHFRGVTAMTDYVEMHVERDGFVGIADVGQGLTTVAAVFPARRAHEFSGDPAAFLVNWLASVAHLAPRFARAVLDGAVAVTGPFASRARKAWAPGALLVGDAADFFDPFTGEGIYAALRGGELASHAIAQSLCAGKAPAVAPLRAYDRARKTEFAGKWKVEWMIGASVSATPLVNRAVRALSARKELADLLVGVTGDFIPPGEVLRADYLASLFLVPPGSHTIPAWR